MDAFNYTSVPGPFGPVWMAAGTRGLVAAAFGVDELFFTLMLSRRGQVSHGPDALPEAQQQLADYFAGRLRSFDLPLDLTACPPFQRAVLEAVAAVPYGEVVSYGEIARSIGNPRAARAVGTAVADNPITIVIPCHRIIRGDGTAGEYGLRSWGRDGVRYKQALLRLEGLDIPASPPGKRLARRGRQRQC